MEKKYLQEKNYLSLQDNKAKKLSLNFIQFESEILQNCTNNESKLEILESEREFKNSIKLKNKEFIIRGRVDRIDKFDGILRIIDYKTGVVNKSDLTIDKFDELLDNPKKSKGAFQL